MSELKPPFDKLSSMDALLSVDSLLTARKKFSKFSLSMEQKIDLRKAFNIFGAYNTGKIQPSDLRVAIRCLGFEYGNKKINELIKMINTEKDPTISFEDFVFLMTYVMAAEDSRADLIKAFNVFPKESNGEISFQNLKDISQSLGEALNDEELQELITAADTDKNGTVSAQEFVNICDGLVLWNYW